MKKLEAVRLIKPSHDELDERRKIRRESMNTYRAVRGRVGNEKSRHLFDLYGELCRASAVGGKPFEDVERLYGAVCVRCVLAGDAQAFRDLADYIEYWPPSEAKQEPYDRVVSPTYVAAERFFHYARRGGFSRADARRFIERESGQRVSDSHLTDLIDRYGMKSILEKCKPGPKPSSKRKRKSTKAKLRRRN